MFAPWYIAFINLLFGCILLSLSILVYQKKQILGQSFFWLLLLCDSLFSCTVGVYYLIGEITREDSNLLSLIVFGLVYSLIYLSSVLWFFYSACYSGRGEYLTRTRIAIIGGAMVLGCIFRFLDMLPLPADTPWQRILSELIGVLHYAAAYYFFALIIIGIYFVLERYHTVSARFRRQIEFLVIGIGILLCTRLALETILDGYHSYGFDVGISGIFLAFGVLHYDILKYSPVFRDRFFTLSDHGLLVLNQNDEIVDMNPAAEGILNISIRDAFGKKAADIPSLPDPFSRLLADPDHIDQTYYFPIQHQVTHWYQVTSRAPDTKEESEISHLITITDVTHTVALEQEIQKARIELHHEKEKIAQEQRYRQQFISSPEATLIFSRGQIIDCNPAALDLFSLPKSELLGTDLSRLSSPRQDNPDDIPEKLAYYLSQANTGSVVHFSWIFCAGEKKIDAQVRLFRLDYDGTTLVEMVIFDMARFHLCHREGVRDGSEREQIFSIEKSLWDQASSLVHDPVLSKEEKERAFQRILNASEKNLKKLSESR